MFWIELQHIRIYSMYEDIIHPPENINLLRIIVFNPQQIRSTFPQLHPQRLIQNDLPNILERYLSISPMASSTISFIANSISFLDLDLDNLNP